MTIRRWTLAVVCLATAMLMLDIAVVNTALSQIARDLHASATALQWVVDAYTVALATVVLTSGSLADRLGRRRLFAGGLVLFTGASLACAFAGSGAALDAARAVQGIGAAALFATSLALLAHAFPQPAERTRALAAYGATIAGSFAVGPVVGGALTSALGWRWIFLVNVPIGIAALLITRARVEESRDPRAPRIDWPGQILLTGGLLALVMGLLRGNQDGWGSGRIVAELAVAAALLGGFVVVERRSAQPMLPLGLFRRRRFAAAQLTAAAISASFFSVYFYLSLYAQNVLGLSPIAAGAVFLPCSAVMFLVAGATAPLAGRVSERTMLVGGLVLVAAGQALMLTAAVDSSWTVLLPGALVAGIGCGMFNPTLSGVALGSVPAEQSGLAAGVNDTFRQTGIAVGVAALGALVPAAEALGGGSPDAYVSGLHHALMAGTGLAAVGAVAGALLLRERRTERAGRPELALEAA